MFRRRFDELVASMPRPTTAHKEWRFVEELREPRRLGVSWSKSARDARDGELDLGAGVAYRGGFDDPLGSLLTAEDSLRRFLRTAGLENAEGVPLHVERDAALPREAYRLEIGTGKIQLWAADTEGVRRGLYGLEDRLAGSEGAFLPLGVEEKRYWVRNRISRCFFGPIKRPPLNRDELMDDVDYYPDAYLDRLAHEGVNGLWLTIVLSEVCHSSILAPSPKAERRLVKLRRTVEQCLRYGIKTWVFCIEPRALASDDPLVVAHPELRGATTYDGSYCFCPSSATADRHLFELTHSLFTAVPGLGGLINISHGERPTTCLSAMGLDRAPIDCPRCGELEPWQIIHRSLAAMSRGMRAANPEAELISWFYKPYAETHAEWTFEMAGHMPEGVTLQYNFESGVVRRQLGKPRIGGDYWLSEVGPATNFARVAERSRGNGTPVSAKLQVGCSHEVATAPFVPVPSLVYRKFRAMRELGCSSAMLCWYFGNYPGLMNRAAGMLASEEFGGGGEDGVGGEGGDEGEKDFLLRLARPEWGDAAKTVARAWGLLADGYANYPLDTMPGYYGPMHDGVVWPLLARVGFGPMARTWQNELYPSGDIVGESLGGFTLPEALDLFERILRLWEEGTELMIALRPEFAGNADRLRDIGVVEALRTQFRSGRNIYRFYYLRFLLMHGRGDSAAHWEELRAIVEDEIANSRRMLELCAEDPRLGFHSEAETYKVFPEKLRWRIAQLEELLAEELPALRAAREAGESAFVEAEESMPVYRCGQGWVEGVAKRWRCDQNGEDLVFKVECWEESEGSPSYVHLYLLDASGVAAPWRFFVGPEISATAAARINMAWGESEYRSGEQGRWAATVRVPGVSWQGDTALRPAYISVLSTTEKKRLIVEEEHWPALEGERMHRLNLARFDPRWMARLEW